MSARDRYVVLDDRDSAIRYSSGWSTISGNDWDSRGNFGRTYGGTLHSATSGASFSTTFRGSAGRVTGTINTKTSNGVVDPTWECKVDDVIFTGGSFSSSLNNYDLCKWFGNEVSDGEHTLTVTVRSNGQAFLFDRFQYVPSSGTTIANAEVSASYLDSAIAYGSGWQRLGDVAYMAADGGAVVDIPFYGTGITWIGITPAELPHTESRAQWQIDGGSPTTFVVPGTQSLTNHFVEIFRTISVDRGHHTLTVTHLGTTSLTPLVLSRFLIHDGMLPEPARSPSDSGGGGTGGTGNNTGAGSPIGGADDSTAGGSSVRPMVSPTHSGVPKSSPSQVIVTITASDGSIRTTAIPDPLSVAGANPDNTGDTGATKANSAERINVGAVIGGVLGGLALLLVIVVLVLWGRRKKKRAAGDAEHTEHIIPFIDGNGQASNASRDNVASSSSIFPFLTDRSILPSLNTSQSETSGKGGTVNRHPAIVTSLMNEKSSSITQTPSFAPSPSNSSRPTTSTNMSTSQVGTRTPTPHMAQSKHQESTQDAIVPDRVTDIHHEDSGIRLITDEVFLSRPNDPLVVVEYPPIYSAS